MRTQLTKRVVANAQPQAKPYEMRDILVRGLILRVQPSGHKAWIVSWAHGKRRTLGAVDHLTLEQARAHASQAMAEAVQQRLPSVAKAKVTTWRMPKEGEAYTGIWHKRYYEAGSKMRKQAETGSPAASGGQLKIG